MLAFQAKKTTRGCIRAQSMLQFARASIAAHYTRAVWFARGERTGARVAAVSLAARVARLPTAMQAGNLERAALYRSRRWRHARDAFLRLYPLCSCGARAVLVDHRDGHQCEDWRARFWSVTTWQPMCGECHAAKSAHEWMEEKPHLAALAALAAGVILGAILSPRR